MQLLQGLKDSAAEECLNLLPPFREFYAVDIPQLVLLQEIKVI